MAITPSFSDQHLEAIAKQLGDTLTGSEITGVLQWYRPATQVA
jgi:hypothetical protein